jgi:hypothetical protein
MCDIAATDERWTERVESPAAADGAIYSMIYNKRLIDDLRRW